jgi:hypothetical protein
MILKRDVKKIGASKLLYPCNPFLDLQDRWQSIHRHVRLIGIKMKSCLIAAAYLCLNLVPPAALADTVFLKNGKEIKVEDAWQEGDQIWLIYLGVKASIPQSKVMRIAQDANDPRKTGSHKRHNKASKKVSHLQSAVKIRPNQTPQAPKSLVSAQQPARNTAKLHKDGFGDLKWGDSATDVEGLEIRQTDSGLRDVIEYVRPSDKPVLGDAKLKRIIYAFWRDELYTVTIWTQGPENYKALRKMVFQQFGKGAHPDRSIEKYLWSDGPADIMLKYVKNGQYGMLWMRGKKMDRKFKLSQMNVHTSYLKWMKASD